MPSSERRNERIDYSASVALFDDSAAGAPVMGRCENVSEGGMLVEAPLAACTGEPLRCELSLDGRHTRLDGQVAWSTAAETSGAQRIGIRFEALSEHDGGILRHVVQSALQGFKPMQLRFDDVAEPVTARACLTDRGLMVSTPLPILDRDKHVGFSFEDGRGPFRAAISDVTVGEQEGERRLQILLHVEPRERRRIERHTVHGYQLDTADRRSSEPAPRAPRARQLTTPVWRVGSEVDPPTEAPEAPPATAAPIPRRQHAPAWLAVTLALLVGGAVGWAVAGAPTPSERIAPESDVERAPTGARVGGGRRF